MPPGSDHRSWRARRLGLAAFSVLLLQLCAAATGAAPLRVVTISDLNGSYGSTDYDADVDAAVERIIALRPDLVISAGDMVAGQRRPHLNGDQVEAMWLAFHRHVSDRLAAADIPMAVTPGNHDASAYHGFEGERAAFSAQWLQRKPALPWVDDSAYPWNYAFALGDTLFISLDVTRVGHLEPAQKQWLSGLLETQGQRYRHRVIFSHVPLWPLARGRESEYSGDGELQSLLLDHAVELYISGHQHAFFPGYKDGLNLLGLSCLGAAPRRLIGSAARSPRSIALLEIHADRIDLAALRAPGFTSSLPWSSLPEEVQSEVATLRRADLAQDTLREISAPPGQPAERSQAKGSAR